MFANIGQICLICLIGLTRINEIVRLRKWEIEWRKEKRGKEKKRRFILAANKTNKCEQKRDSCKQKSFYLCLPYYISDYNDIKLFG